MITSDHSAATGPHQDRRAAVRTATTRRLRSLTLRDVDALAGAVLVCLGGFVLMQSLQLDFYVEGVPGPGFFPALLGVLLMALGAGLLIRRWWGPTDSADDFSLPTRLQVSRSLSLWLLLLVGALLVGPLGFPIAMLLLVAAILFGIERRRGIGAVLTTVLIPVLAWLVFGLLLQVPLPMGPLGS